MNMVRGLGVAVLVGMAAWQAAAQTPDSQSRAHALRAVSLSCQAEVRRYCPADLGAGARNAVICLKDFRSNLSLGCRHAVVGALH